MYSLPLSAQLHFDFSPYLWMDTFTADDDHDPTLQELYDWYARPPFSNLSLDLQKWGFRAYTQFEFRSDLLADLTYFSWSNFPIIREGTINIDANFPQVAYLEYSREHILISLGRRKISWGPGIYHLGISGIAPYFDNLYLDFSVPTKKGEWGFRYVIITTDNRAMRRNTETEDPLYKTLVAHQLSYQWPRIKISLLDYSLVWNRVPDLQELAPLLHYHGLYQEDQNVMLGIALDMLPGDNFRIYMDCIFDDFKLSVESTESNPGAAGAILGTQIRFLRGKPVVTELNQTEDHILDDRTFPLQGGLILQFEQVWASKYLYNRDVEEGKFINPQFYIWKFDPADINTFFGAAYGPDRLIERLSLTYENNPFKADFLFEYHLIGGLGIDGPYEPPFEIWLTFGEPITHQFRTGLRGSWFYKPNSRLFGDITVDFGENFLFQCGIGWHIALF